MSGSLELDEIMRQKEDGEFAQLLCRVRTADSTEEEIKKLESRSISEDDTNQMMHFMQC